MSVEKLKSWLKANEVKVGSTIMMPLKLDKKEPMYVHKDGAWSVDKMERWAAMNPTYKAWGLLLDRVCALDADDADSVELLEDAVRVYPELSRCPVQDTKHGAHYLFLRLGRTTRATSTARARNPDF
jgi:hypothetical protein